MLLEDHSKNYQLLVPNNELYRPKIIEAPFSGRIKNYFFLILILILHVTIKLFKNKLLNVLKTRENL
jgi:hypothetical protein